MNIPSRPPSKRRTYFIVGVASLIGTLATMVLVWVVFGIKDFFTVLPPLSSCGIPMTQPLAWASGDGVSVSRDGGKTVKNFPFRFRTGAPIGMQTFALWHSKLVYWSASDNSLGVVSSTGRTVWISLARLLKPYGESLEGGNSQLCASPNGVLLNLSAQEMESRKETDVVVSIDLTTKVATILSGVIAARSAQDSAEMVIEDTAHHLRIGTGGSFRSLFTPDAFLADQEIDWDYDSTTQTLYWTDMRDVSSTRETDPRHQVRDLDIPPNFLVYEVVPSPQTHQVWVTGRSDQGFDHDPTVYLLVFTETGKFIGVRLIDEDGMYPPVFLATPTEIALFQRL